MPAGSRALLVPIVSLGVAALGCATPKAPSVPPSVIEGYQLFAKRDCGGVRALRLAADASEAGAEREPLRLVDAYCLELEGDTAAAKELYASIVAADSSAWVAGPRTWVAAEAKHRLIRLDIETVERVSGYREKLKERPSRSPEPVRPTESPTPNYPFPAYEARIEGWVLLDFEVLSDGRVFDAVVLASEPPFVFDRAALLAIQAWKYEASPSREPFRHKIELHFAF